MRSAHLARGSREPGKGLVMRISIEAERAWVMLLIQLQQNRIAMQAAA